MTPPDQAPPNPFGRGILNGPADFVPEWDVGPYGGRPTEALLRAIEAIDGSARVDPDRKIHVLLGPPGYGKTHVFGRLAHRLRDRVLFVFVPPIQDVRRPLAHVRHHVVMSLFAEPPGGRSRLAGVLARLCRPSFVRYLAGLPRPLDARYADLLERLRAGDEAVFEIVDAVKTLPPFGRVGASLQQLYPQVDAGVLRALALGWSRERDYVCRWLRGEAIAEEHARRIGLPDDPPDAVEVIKAVALLCAGHAPVVLCVDQLDNLLAEKDTAPLQFSTAVMTLRSEVPNLLVVVSCLKAEWADLSLRFHAAFKERTVEHELEILGEGEAAELVRLRLASWAGAPAARPAWWPINETSFRRWVGANLMLRPRGLLKECEGRYDDWAERGDLGVLIEFGATTAVDPSLEFRREWDAELAAAEKDGARSVDHVQDQRLAKALKEALSLHAAGPPGSHPLTRVEEDAVPQARNNPDPYRYSFEVALSGTDGVARVIVALEVSHNARKFGPYLHAIVERLNAGAAGAVLVTPKAEVSAGPAAKAEMDAEAKQNRLRVVSLLDYRQDFARLECLLALLERASAQNLQVAGTTVDADRCRELVRDGGMLAHLALLDRILDGWVTAPDVAAPEPSTQRVVPAPAAVPAPAPRPAVDPTPAGETPVPAPAPEPDDPLSGERLDWAADSQDLIAKRLSELGARVRSMGSVEIGPTFARFLVTPYPATSISKVRNRAEDLKVGLGVDTLPLVGSQAGAISIDVQLPERFRRSVRLGAMGLGPDDASPGVPAFPVGQDVAGHNHWLDLSDPNSCHLLVAGTTGSGKSEFLKVLIAALARRLGPGRVAFALIDPKQVTFNFGDRAGPFLIRPVANGPDEALGLVEHCFEEAERRFSELKQRRLEDLAQWQAADPEAPPRLVLVCDEFADLMADRESKKALETPLKRLGAKARAAGIHLVLATQRPEATVVTPLLRSNLPARICFRVASAADSKLILKDPDGADLLGRGDLIWQRGAGSVRLQSPYVDRDELEAALFPPRLATAGA